MMSRRNFMAVGGMGMAGLAMGVGTMPAAAAKPLPTESEWLTALGQSLKTEHDYRPRVDGQIPSGLRGQLFRNGPGLFERDDYRKQHILDGDGMIQCFDFTDDGVRYRNRFVRTEKFLAEEEAGKFLYPTWTTRAPGGPFSNVGSGIKTQAGVTTIVRDGKLLAMDEGIPYYALDPNSLETTGTYEFPAEVSMEGCKAHTRTDPATGDWIIAGTSFGPTMHLQYLILDRNGGIKAQGRYESPRMIYLHDFFATERYIIFVLHPVEFSPLPFLSGFSSFTDSLSWSPDGGNLVMIFDKAGGEPTILEAPAAFMWHGFNAYERGGEIVADFIGYDNPDHFIGSNPAFKSVMRGEAGEALHAGKLRRYVMSPGKKVLTEEVLHTGHHEFPVIDLRVSGRAYRYGFSNRGGAGDWVLDGVAKLDMQSGRREEYRFGSGNFVSEPIFAPRGAEEGDGWLLAQVQERESGNNFLAIFDADNIPAGPAARVHLTHHVPLSFHGFWTAS